MTRVRLHSRRQSGDPRRQSGDPRRQRGDLRSQIALATVVSQVVLATWLVSSVSAASFAHSDGRAATIDAPIANAAGRVIAAPCTNTADCPAQPTHEDDLPWCVSADDPRCAPLHTGTRSQDTDSHRIAPSAACDPTSMAVAPAYRASFTPASGLLPQAGIDQRVERPPRSSERSVRAL
jgi:hypothetical protein